MAGIKNSFSKGLTTINVKASNFMEENKLRTYITTLENDIEKMKYSVGEKMYQSYINNNIAPEGVREELETIREKYSQITQITTEIEALTAREKEILGKGGNLNNNSQEGIMFCSMCGSPYKKGYKFCEKCGNKLD